MQKPKPKYKKENKVVLQKLQDFEFLFLFWFTVKSKKMLQKQNK